MKPATAAKKLDVYLPATPAEFQENAITRTELAALQADPPQWLKDLRKNGPHPKNLVAAKLGVSIAGLARGGVTMRSPPSRSMRCSRTSPSGWSPNARATRRCCARSDG